MESNIKKLRRGKRQEEGTSPVILEILLLIAKKESFMGKVCDIILSNLKTGVHYYGGH